MPSYLVGKSLDCIMAGLLTRILIGVPSWVAVGLIEEFKQNIKFTVKSSLILDTVDDAGQMV